MKKSLIIFISIICSLPIYIQAQNSFYYQSALRNTDGTALANKDVNVRFSILADDNTVYAETHQSKTDANGCLVLYIGEGTAQTGNFAQTDWSKAGYRIKTEIDRGEGYTLSGVQPLAGVPYAMLAETAGGIQQKSADGTTWTIAVGNDGQLSAQKEESSIIPIPDGYTRLVFNDEFNGTGLPDATKWGYEEGYVRNGETQYYTVAREENAFQKDGYLHLLCENKPTLIENARVNVLWKDEWTERRKDTTISVTSASLHTLGIASWKFCRIDVRAKLPKCKGTWPAIWMMPVNGKHGYWPKSGEIDIMEHVGYAPDDVHFTLHCYSHNSGTWPNKYNRSIPCPTSYTEFHTYSLVWTETRIEWHLDGQVRYYVNRPKDYTWLNWPFGDDEFYLILNLGFGGGWGGREGIDLGGLPQDYQIDYVRIYQ